MTTYAADPTARLPGLLDVAPPYDLVNETARFLAETVGASEVALLLADYSGTTLERLPAGPVPDQIESIPIAGTLPGRSHVQQEAMVEADAAGVRVWAPVTVRCDRLGVLEVVAPTPMSDATLDLLQRAGRILAAAVFAAQSYTDLFHRVRRRQELTLAAELQWQLLPVLACTGAEFSLAGALEPAYDIGGDSFDYAMDAHRISLAVLDGMGHGLPAALLATVALAAVRNARRWGYDLTEQARAAGGAVFEQYWGDQFVTALLVEIDRRRGEALVVNAGHPPPLRVRGGRAEAVAVPPGLPLGLFPDHVYEAHRFSLAPGDRLLLISDGVVEATPSGGEPYGLERLCDLLSTDLLREGPEEVVRSVGRAVITHRADMLRDDTTTVCLDWLGPGMGGATEG